MVRTLLGSTIYFVGGLNSALLNATPLSTMSSLDLNTLTFTETNLSAPIFDHAATTEQVDPTSNDNRIGIVFGKTSVTTNALPLQWLNTTSGALQAPANTTTGGGRQPTPFFVPTGRSGHSLIQIRNTFWTFGGRGNGGSSTMTDSPSYNAKDIAWSSKAKGLARYEHASVQLDAEKILSCYGAPANTNTPNLDSDCVVFSITPSTFQSVNLNWVNPDDAIKGGRLGVTLVPGSQNYIVYMFGGRSTDGTTYSQDVYRLDATKLPDVSISKLVMPPDLSASYIPSARSGHVAVPVVHGGSGPGGMANGSPYFFSTSAKTWVSGDYFSSEFQKEVPSEEVSVTVIIIGILAGVSVLGACVAFYIWKGLRDDQRKKDAEGVLSPTYSNDSPRDGTKSAFERKSHVYPSLGDSEDHSMSAGPFKSTSSLIQPEETKSKKKGSKPWVNDPQSPSGTTLTEGSIHGYASSSGTRTNNPNGSNSNLANSRNSGPGGSGSSIQSSRRSGGGHESYYNPRDLFLETEDDDSSITVSLASESTLSPWAGPVRLSSDLAPPNPRFSRGAMSQAHRQLVRSSGGWDTSSPGGSLSSREDDGHRRSVNSMQWVSFEAFDPSVRPESIVFDPLAARSNLTVRNASYYGGNGNAPRLSMYGGSASGDNMSDGTDDSNYNQGGKRISAALAARQQRRSFRNSQESFKGNNNGGSSNSDAGDAFVTKVLPIITTKVTKPSLAKVVNQRGSRIVVPSSGPLGRRDDEEYEGGQNPESIGSLPNFGSENYANGPSRGHPQGRRTSSTLNPGYKTQNQQKRESRLSNSTSASGTNVILRMPPPPKHPSGLRDSIAELGQDMPGFLNYGEDHS
ncbi:hypothetical protein CPC16_001316 [Podila verticillata]|nr:hypothetical protein CPC16_001316 [Podila verticillata]